MGLNLRERIPSFFGDHTNIMKMKSQKKALLVNVSMKN